jgi:HAD superfamily hydrolase (TIGR01459 family)
MPVRASRVSRSAVCRNSALSRFLRIASCFKAAFFDQYGVLHDGRNPYPGARDALAALKSRGVKIVVVSNSGRTGEANGRRMATLGFGPELYDFLVTSGDVARALLKSSRIPASLATGARCFVISSGGDDDFARSLGLASAAHGEDADLVIIAGSQADRLSLEEYARLLTPAARRGAPCVCVNPDKLMLTAKGAAPGPGRIAEVYQELGGEVAWIGKPFPEIYEAAAELSGAWTPSDVLCVGDSVEHDIAGAHAFGAFAALVRTGVLTGLSEKEIAREIGRHGAVPDFVIEDLTC